MKEEIKSLLLEKENGVYKYTMYALKKMGYNTSLVKYWGLKLRDREGYKKYLNYKKKYSKEVQSGHVK